MTRITLMLLLIASTFTMPTISQAQTAIGKAEQIKTRVSGKGSRRLKTRSRIYANERIRANSTGLGHFRFADDTKLVVGPGTNLVLDEIVYNPNGSKFKKFVLDSSRGATRFISGNSGSSTYKVETPVGTLGLRGTAFDIQHWRGRTYVMLLEGSLRVCNNQGVCRTLRRRCSCVIINPVNISRPFTPKEGIFSDRDMAIYFPFVANPSLLLPDYRIPGTQRCQGGASTLSGEQAEPAGSPPSPPSPPSTPSTPSSTSDDADST